jgi:cyclophilin family peptidyl-prolyl cis-trans isomerase
MSLKNCLRTLITCTLLISLSVQGFSAEKKVANSLIKDPNNPVVLMKTNMGDITIELYKKEAPITVENFINYINSGFYENTIFHRVINGFMIQGGGFESGLKQKETLAPIKNEAKNGLSNKTGTLAMARTNVVDSATAQFFINVQDNAFLDHSPKNYGYAVFGKVVEGMDVVNAIKAVKTATVSQFQNVPKKDVIIKKVTLIKKENASK